jgi:hypothetical protein
MPLGLMCMHSDLILTFLQDLHSPAQATGPLPDEILTCVRSFSIAEDGPSTYQLLGELLFIPISASPDSAYIYRILPNGSLTSAGHRLQVVHRTSSSWYALGPRRELGIAALQIPLGVLLVTFGR